MLRLHVFSDDEPGLPLPARAQAFALPERVINGAFVTADPLAVQSAELPGACSHVLTQKFPEIPLADEANSGAVFLGLRREIIFFGETRTSDL